MREGPQSVSLRVLVVEDDDDWREIIRKQFENRGCMVTTATSLDSAEQRLQGETFDIVTLDMWLTSWEQEFGNVDVSGGWRLLDHLAQQDPHPLVFVISGGFEDNPKRAFDQGKLGVRDFVTKKGFELRKIDEWIQLAKGSKETSPEDRSEGGYPLM
jgi:CheY-like chemotaxis protein